MLHPPFLLLPSYKTVSVISILTLSKYRLDHSRLDADCKVADAGPGPAKIEVKKSAVKVAAKNEKIGSN